jgi:hypothetical protein
MTLKKLVDQGVAFQNTNLLVCGICHREAEFNSQGGLVGVKEVIIKESLT